MNIKQILIAGTCSFSPLFSLANSDNTSEMPSQGLDSHTIYISGGRVSIDSEVAGTEGVDDSAIYFRLGWEGQKKNWVIGAGLSGYEYSDKREFSQAVVDNYGDQSTDKSGASAVNLYFESGYSLVVNQHIQFDALAGLEWVMESSRSISYCTDCYEENIDVNGGFYITPRAKFTASNGFTFYASYHSYITGDIKNGFSIGLGATF